MDRHNTCLSFITAIRSTTLPVWFRGGNSLELCRFLGRHLCGMRGVSPNASEIGCRSPTMRRSARKMIICRLFSVFYVTRARTHTFSAQRIHRPRPGCSFGRIFPFDAMFNSRLSTPAASKCTPHRLKVHEILSIAQNRIPFVGILLSIAVRHAPHTIRSPRLESLCDYFCLMFLCLLCVFFSSLVRRVRREVGHECPSKRQHCSGFVEDIHGIA